MYLSSQLSTLCIHSRRFGRYGTVASSQSCLPERMHRTIDKNLQSVAAAHAHVSGSGDQETFASTRSLVRSLVA